MPQHDLLFVCGDLNAQVGSQQSDWPDVIGKFGLGLANDNGERLL